MSADISLLCELRRAVASGHVKMVRLILDIKPDIVRNNNVIDKKSLLHLASRVRYIDNVELLLRNGAEVNTRDSIGRTSLYYASEEGHADIVELLLSNGADVDIKTDYLNTPLYVASDRGHTDVVMILIRYKADVRAICNWGWTGLHTAAGYGHIDTVILLLNNGADIDSTGSSSSSTTPLHHASYFNRPNMVQYLLNNGADPNAKDNELRTPLNHVLKSYMNNSPIEIVKLLLEDGADPNIKDLALYKTTYPDIIGLLKHYENLNQLKEWRPWNHSEYPFIYRQVITTLAILAKSCII